METSLRSHARARPNAVAVACGARCVTYGELDALADAFACAVRARCGRGERVALLFPHGPEAVAAMFGALRAGTAYVPLDPAWPDERIAFVIGDTAPALVAALPRDARRLSALAGAASFVWHPRAGASAPPLATDAPDAPAYVLYTSGSNGVPKGVVQSRGNLAAHALAYARSLRARNADRFSGLASFAFDAAAMDVFGSVAAGAALCCYDPRGARLAGVADWLAAARVSIWHATPTLFRAVLGAVRARLALPSLRAVVFGGEPLHAGDVALARERLPRRVALINGFGPTECTVALQHRVARGAPLGARVPIGRPVPGVEVLLRDDGGRIVEGPGAGEIVLRTERVALAYWRRGEATEAAFGRDPVSGVRTYATGDAGLRLPSGELVHLGRRDDQVKVRGHRVEPAEIEARVAEIAGVRHAVVVAAEHGGETRLTAWFVPARPGKPSAAEVRAKLRASLPPFMVPAAIRPRRALPLLATGKIDRRRLADDAAARLRARPPRSVRTGRPLEDELVAIWSDALGVAPALDDDFFALGGDSLLALRVACAAEAALGGPVPSVFRHPTIAAFARAARRAHVPERTAAAANGAAVPLSPQQRRYWARCRAAGSDAFTVRFAFELHGRIDAGALRRALADVVRSHDALRLVFALDGATPVQTARASAALALPVEHAGARGWDDAVDRAARGLHVELDGALPLRAKLLRRSATEHALVVAFHHLAIDGWSRELFVDELFGRYALPRAGRAARASSFLAACERSRAVSPTAVRRVLGGARAAPLLTLPGRRGASSGTGAHTVAWTTSRDERRALERCAASLGVSLFAAVAALFAVALAWWARAKTVAITTDRANRTPANAHVIGLFADVAIIRVAVARERPFAEVVRRVHDTVAAAHDGDWPAFADLVDTVWPGALERYDEIVPAAVFLERAETVRSFPGGLSLRAREIASAETSRDVMLVVREGDGELGFRLVYRAERFGTAEVDRVARALRTLTATLPGRAAAPLAEVLACLEGES